MAKQLLVALRREAVVCPGHAVGKAAVAVLACPGEALPEGLQEGGLCPRRCSACTAHDKSCIIPRQPPRPLTGACCTVRSVTTYHAEQRISVFVPCQASKTTDNLRGIKRPFCCHSSLWQMQRQGTNEGRFTIITDGPREALVVGRRVRMHQQRRLSRKGGEADGANEVRVQHSLRLLLLGRTPLLPTQGKSQPSPGASHKSTPAARITPTM